MTRIHQLCSLEANYKSQGRLTLWVSETPTSIFRVSGHPRYPHWLRHYAKLLLKRHYVTDNFDLALESLDISYYRAAN